MVSNSGKTLYRDPTRGKIAGICAGVANHFGWEVWLVRIVALSALIFISKITLIVYIVAWVVLEKAPKGQPPSKRVVKETTSYEYSDDGRAVEVKTRVWEAGEAPKDALKDIAARFDTMEHSVRAMERYVTSSEYKVRQEFNRL